MPTKLDTDYFIDDFVKEEKEIVKETITPFVAKRVLKEAMRIEGGYFKLVADAMNFYSPPHDLVGDGDPFVGITWNRLKRSTLARKREYYRKFGTPDGYQKPSNKWFYTGSLQKFLKRARVGSWFSGREINVSDGVIEYTSNLENERRPFNDKQEAKITGTLKTGGTNEELRPIFEPIREFYVNVRLPKFLDKEADKAIEWHLHRMSKGG